ncbi:unnamed protein product [Paramecium sonneborni]|uniref:Uncharacterized protein n=1 Tax=Paramecium sonneborni TaxID=65129 RepID=A0A8S1LC51_9CILI|nr:unnamed protein product [Paramecium sonneborni]
MLKIQRSKSCDAILITLKNLDKGDNQSQLSFRVYDNSTVLDLIIHIQKSQQAESEIQLYFEQNIQFMGDMNQYIVDIIKRTKNRSIGYRIFQQNCQSKSEHIKIHQKGHSDIQQEKRIMATQIPISEYYNENINNQSQNKVYQNQIKNKENYSEYYEQKFSQAKDDEEQLKLLKTNIPQYSQQFQQTIMNQDQQNKYPINQYQQIKDGQNMCQQKVYKELELENLQLKQKNQSLELIFKQLQEENRKLKNENLILKNIQNTQQSKEISPQSQRIQDNRLSQSIFFTNSCKHQIKEQNLEEILQQAIYNKQIAKCPQCKKKISNKLCRQIQPLGQQYLEMKNQLDSLKLISEIQKKLESAFNLKLIECSNQFCNFVCIWQQKSQIQTQQGFFCMNCLQNSVENPQLKQKAFSTQVGRKGTK